MTTGEHLPGHCGAAQDIPGIEAGSIIYRIDSLLFFLPKSLKNKVKQNILKGQERAMRKAKAMRTDKHSGRGSKATAGVSRPCSACCIQHERSHVSDFIYAA